jgi:hypothetical protein
MRNRNAWKMDVESVLANRCNKKLRTNAMKYAEVISRFPVVNGCTGILGRKIDAARCTKYVVVEIGVDGKNLYLGKSGACRIGVNQATSRPVACDHNRTVAYLERLLVRLTEIEFGERLALSAKNIRASM